MPVPRFLGSETSFYLLLLVWADMMPLSVYTSNPLYCFMCSKRFLLWINAAMAPAILGFSPSVNCSTMSACALFDSSLMALHLETGISGFSTSSLLDLLCGPLSVYRNAYPSCMQVFLAIANCPFRHPLHLSHPCGTPSHLPRCSQCQWVVSYLHRG